MIATTRGKTKHKEKHQWKKAVDSYPNIKRSS